MDGDEVDGSPFEISPNDWVVYEWDIGIGEGPLRHIGVSHYGGGPVYFDDFSVSAWALGRPDLVINDFNIIEPNLEEGERTKIEIEIRNEGDKEAEGSFVCLLQRPKYTDPIPTPDPDINFAIPSMEYVGHINPHQSEAIELNWDGVNILNIDNNAIELVADCYNLVEESNEKNNTVFVRRDDDYSLTASPFEIAEDAYSFKNWAFSSGELDDLKGRIDLFLRNSVGEGPVAGLLLAALYTIMAKPGHCYGMAATSILYYKNLLEMPISHKSTFGLLKEEARQNIIDYHILQIPSALRHLLLDLACPGHEVSLEEVYDNVEQARQNDRPLMLIFDKHATVAYDAFDVSPTEKNIVIYDNNYPGMGLVVKLDFQKNTAVHPAKQVLKKVFTDFPYLDPVREFIKLVMNYLECQIESLWSMGSRLLVFMSPVNITIVDEEGRIVTDTGINEIPGAIADIDDTTGVKKFNLPTGLNYYVRIEALESGNCRIIQVCPQNENEASLSDTEIELFPETVGEFDILPDSADYVMAVDEDGDGIPDYETVPETTGYKNWDYIFNDHRRGTELRVNINLKTFQFITPDTEYPVLQDTGMKIRELRKANSVVGLRYGDDDISVFAIIVDSKRDFCVATLRDSSAGKAYLLVAHSNSM